MTVVAESSASATTFHWPLTDEQFARLCALNPEMRFESTCTGDLIVMPPASSETGERNASLTADVVLWNRATAAGRVFDSSAGFLLPNGARRSPDVSWISHPRWDALHEQDRQGFARICPDVVVELMSPTDRLRVLQEKMEEYLDNGARLGWLIDPRERIVYVYRPGEVVQRFEAPDDVTGEPVAPGLVLQLKSLWVW